MDKKSKTPFYVIIFILILIFFSMFSDNEVDRNAINKYTTSNSRIFKIIASSENKDLEYVIKNYAKTKKYDIDIEYAGTLDIMQKLNSGKKYDAVWVSNSIWLYMLDDSVKISDSKYTSINPVIFGITKSKAEQLGFINKTVYTQDIVNAINEGKLKFSMSNPTSTNSGASAYLGMLSTLAGNPEVLTEENLNNEELKQKLITLFTGMERSSGSEDFLEELFLKGDYEAVVTYESSIININKQLVAKGKEPLYAIYPVDGVSISDSPFAYIDNKDSNKKNIFIDLQTYILSNEGQKILQEKGRRTWYGGVTSQADKEIFNPEWGIDTTKYITPTKYPNTKVIKLALNLYQTQLRKTVHVVFCLDYSGSMVGSGNKELVDAMDYILTDRASADFIQFSEKDKIDVIAFGSRILGIWETTDGTKTNSILSNIKNTDPTGSTALYLAAIKALSKIETEDTDKYNVSIILMTDGQANVGTYYEFESAYKLLNKDIPVYSIMFGNADKDELEDIAELTNAKVFDGKQDLVKAFREVRGYN